MTRFSFRSEVGEAWASVIRDRQREQSGRSIGKGWNEAMLLTLELRYRTHGRRKFASRRARMKKTTAGKRNVSVR